MSQYNFTNTRDRQRKRAGNAINVLDLFVDVTLNTDQLLCHLSDLLIKQVL